MYIEYEDVNDEVLDKIFDFELKLNLNNVILNIDGIYKNNLHK